MANAPTRFVILKSFYCEPLRSHYIEGMGYKVTPQNSIFLNEWIKSGAAALQKDTAGTASPSKVTGKGEVK